MKLSVLTLIVVMAGLVVTPAPAAAQDIELGGGAAVMGLLVVTDAVSLVANTILVAKGDGSTTMGWVGGCAGALTAVIALTTSDIDDWVAPAGAAVMGMGIWSATLAGHRKNDLGANYLEFEPGVARRTDGAVEARLTLTLRL